MTFEEAKQWASDGAKRRNWQVHCCGKQAYKSRAVANAVCTRIKRQRPCRVYKCPSCGKYHLGTP